MTFNGFGTASVLFRSLWLDIENEEPALYKHIQSMRKALDCASGFLLIFFFFGGKLIASLPVLCVWFPAVPCPLPGKVSATLIVSTVVY